jgi:hypothetical protein
MIVRSGSARERRRRLLGAAWGAGAGREHFRHARLILNFLTDRFLFEYRERWFSQGS